MMMKSMKMDHGRQPSRVLLLAGIPFEPDSVIHGNHSGVVRHSIGSNSAEASTFRFGDALNHSQTLSVLVIRQDSQGLLSWIDFVRTVRTRTKTCFIICVHVHKHESQDDALLRLELADAGVSMVTHGDEAVLNALQMVFAQVPGRFPCVFCRLTLSEDALWLHTPLYHINERNAALITCPICGEHCNPDRDPYPVHIRNAHGPCARGEVESEYDRHSENIFAFSLIVCIREMAGKKQMLLVQEFASVGFWLPGGRVDRGEDLQTAALRECKEEAGCDISLKGVLQFQYSAERRRSVRLRVVFYAEPVDPLAPLKTLPDYESASATWVDLDTVAELHRKRKLRSSEPYDWAEYLTEGGTIHPMTVLGTE